MERIFAILNQWSQKWSPPKIIEPLTSKWRQKCSLLQIIEPLTAKTWGQGERKNKERNGETPLRMSKYFEWIIKQLMNSAFIGYEKFCRSRGCYPPRPSASVDNTLLDLQNSSYPTQPHSIIAKSEHKKGHNTGFFCLPIHAHHFLCINIHCLQSNDQIMQAIQLQFFYKFWVALYSRQLISSRCTSCCI